jgi:transcriptional regulator with XRE-family HTH domain
MMRAVDDARIGRSLWVLRRRRGLTQTDLATAADVSQGCVSLIERGHVSSLSIKTVRALFAAVDAGFEGHVTWRGGVLDRVLDEDHARLVSSFAEMLQSFAWTTYPEVTFSQYGERGSIDILALVPTRTLALVVEVKTQITSVDATLRRLDVKSRLASRIVFEREGWRPSVIGCLLVVRDSTTARRRVDRFAGAMTAALPARGAAARTWLRDPTGPLRGLIFVPVTNGRSRRRDGPPIQRRKQRNRTHPGS